MSTRRTTHWAVVAFALAMAWPLGTVDAATTRASAVPAKLLGVWHKKMTDADWARAGVSRDAGVYTFVVKRNGTVTIYVPGNYRASCSGNNTCSKDFTTTFTAAAGRLTLGPVPVCSFKGLYRWHLSGTTLILKPLADSKCIVRETFLGGRWKR